MTAIPARAEEISRDWLAEVLFAGRDGLPDGLRDSLRGVALEDSHSGTTGRALLRLDWGDKYSGAELPRRLFVKLPPPDEAQRAFVAEVGMGRTEARFYRDLAHALPIPVPRCYHADFNESGDRYVMVLEHLEDRGCTFRNASTRYSLDYLRSVLDQFARLHARFWDSPDFGKELGWVEPPAFHPMGPALVERALGRYAPNMPENFGALARFYIDNAAAVHELWRRGTPTLVHGDIHDGNMFFDPAWEGRGGPGFLDWGVLNRTSCMRDVAYFLAGTPTPEDREAHLPALLDHYFRRLEESGVAGFDRSALQEQFRWHTGYVWVASVTTLAMGSQWQPVNYVSKTLGRLHRSVTADRTLESLREAVG